MRYETHRILTRLQIIHYLARLLGQPTHVAMYSSLNEFEECRGQALTLTKRLDYLDGYYEELRKGLQAHGHQPTQYMYTDNAAGKAISPSVLRLSDESSAAELSFHENATPSLTENVQHVLLNPFSHLRPLVIPNTYTCHFYEGADLIDAACCSLLSSLQSTHEHHVIGFDIKYETSQDSRLESALSLDLIQLASEHKIYVFRVRLLTMTRMSSSCMRLRYPR